MDLVVYVGNHLKWFGRGLFFLRFDLAVLKDIKAL